MSGRICRSKGHVWKHQGTYSKCERCGKTKRNRADVRVKRVVPETGELIEQTLPASHFRQTKEERISRDFRAKVLACQRPGLIWPGEQDCPVESGEVLEVGSGVTITVYKVKRTKGGDHRGYYTVDDDRPALPRRTPQMFEPPETNEYGDPIAHTAEAIAAATIDGNYTQDPKQAVTGVGPEVDIEYRRVLGVKKRANDAEYKRKEQPMTEAEKDAQRAAKELQQLVARSVKAGLDPVAVLAPINRAISEAHAGVTEQGKADRDEVPA